MDDAVDSEIGPRPGIKSPLTRRTLLGGAALAIGGAALAACTNSSTASGATSSGQSLLKTIQTRGQLNVVAILQFPPEMYRDKSNQPAGYDPDLMKMIAADLK